MPFKDGCIYVVCFEKEVSFSVFHYYFMKYENANSGNPNTFLFDEIDKSLDINNIYQLYVNIFPEIIKKYKTQIILVSHSPIILSDKIYNSDYYNIISIDEEYTRECRENLAKLF